MWKNYIINWNGWRWRDQFDVRRGSWRKRRKEITNSRKAWFHKILEINALGKTREIKYGNGNLDLGVRETQR